MLAYQRLLLWRKRIVSIPVTISCQYFLNLGWNFLVKSPLHDFTLSGLTLCMSCTYSHRHCQFASAVSRKQCHHVTPTSSSCSYGCLNLGMRGCGLDISFWQGILKFHVLGILNLQLVWTKKTQDKQMVQNNLNTAWSTTTPDFKFRCSDIEIKIAWFCSKEKIGMLLSGIELRTWI